MQNHDNESQLVLIVDDVQKNVQLLGGLLKKQGYRVAFAMNGEQALNYTIKHQPDLILLDIMMPNMDGYEVCKRLKDNKTTNGIPILFITALKGDEDEYRGFELGCVDYITKPYSPKIVEARVRTHLQLKKKTDLLESLTSIDGLTEIPNRRKFDEVFGQEWSRAKRSSKCLSLIMIDIDYFKNFNDHYGHTAGDECLRLIAQALSNTVSRPADFVARYGGEEFVAVLPETCIESAVNIANTMRANIEGMHISHAKSKTAENVTLSLGVATIIPEKNTLPVHFINTADKYLYEAKEAGRNQVKSDEVRSPYLNPTTSYPRNFG